VRRRLVISTVVVVLFALVCLGVPTAVLIRRVVHDEAVNRLEREAEAVAVSFSDDLLSRNRITEQDLGSALPTNDRIRLRLADGTELIAGPRGRFDAELSITVEGPERSQLTLSTSGAAARQRVKDALILLAVIGFGVLFVAAVLAWWMARRLTTPLVQVVEVADRIGSGDFSTEVPRSGLSEVDAVADALNRSADRVQELVRAERDFSSNASHQLRSGLTSLRLRLEALAQAQPETNREDALAALAQAEKLSDTVTDLLRMARTGRAGEASRYNLLLLVRHRVARIEPIARRDGRTVRIRAGATSEMVGSPGAVGEALDVLLSNALAHGRGDVEIDITAVNGTHAVTVADGGSGIADDSLDALFSRAPDADGHGIGLSLARSLVEAEGGHLELIQTRPPVFRLSLPSNRASEGVGGA
jgi:signal transduction histidine kinase